MQATEWQQYFTDFLQLLPSELHDCANKNWQQYCQGASEKQCSIPIEPNYLNALWRALTFSDYATSQFSRNPEYPIKIYHSLNQPALNLLTANESWQNYAEHVDDQESLMRALRRFRHFHLLRIFWRDIQGLDTFNEHVESLCALADTIILVVSQYLYEKLITEWGVPQNEKGEQQYFLVLALGKLGGKELNYSSDIDLIFTYPQSGMTSGNVRSISNEQFFLRLGQQFIQLLANITSDGFVFRVDMRLRPHGQSGNLVMNFSALENYYQYQGRDWERYALVKARVITPHKREGEQLLALLQPFVYRRYLDYGAFGALRDMKDLVNEEVKRRNKEKDLKLGKGGIRQIEFLTQAIQLIRGGREPQFREQNLLKALTLIEKSGYIELTDYQQLSAAYIFLRYAEHRIQMLHDEQTHALPKNVIDKTRLYLMMGFHDDKHFKQTLKMHINHVAKHFNLIAAAPNSPPGAVTLSSPLHYKFLWSELHDKEASVTTLSKMGYIDAEKTWEQLQLFKQSRLVQSLKKHASVRLDQVVPALLVLLAKEPASLLLLTRMLRLLRSIVRRSAYLALLIEKPQVLKYLVNICGASEWILTQICSYPVLLDELLTPPSWEEMTNRTYLEQALAERLRWVAENDLESQMEHLRQFKLGCFLSMAALELLNSQSQDVALVLSDITEVILKQVYHISLQFMIEHYQIEESIETLIDLVPFGIIAYGKLGARELNYASDLDLVFLFETQDDNLVLKGKVVLTPAEFSLRLAQRIIHMLNVPTATGVLYDVDVRLRPGGSAGLLVSHLNAYRNYLHQHAWTWELQALVKARCIIGPLTLVKGFEECRRHALSVKRSSLVLAKDIAQMREKMHEHRSNSKQLDVKFMSGGIADIEFIVQYLVLAFAHGYPTLLKARSTTMLLSMLAELHLLPEESKQSLLSIYAQYEISLRRHILQAQNHDERNQFEKERAIVQSIGEHIFQSTSSVGE